MSLELFICLLALETFHFFLAMPSVKSQPNMNTDYKLEVQREDLEIVLTPVFQYSTDIAFLKLDESLVASELFH